MKFFAYFTLFSSLFFATNVLAAPLKSGDSIPSDFFVIGSGGEVQNYDALKGEKGAILLFVRSVGWCPYCQKQVSDWDNRRQEFNERGYNVVSVSYDSTKVIQEFTSTRGTHIAVTSDSGSKMIEAFGILKEGYTPGSRLYGIPDPAVYVVNARGEITSVFREVGYVQRPDIDSVLGAL